MTRLAESFARDLCPDVGAQENLQADPVETAQIEVRLEESA
jgi:hypothetical protein